MAEEWKKGRDRLHRLWVRRRYLVNEDYIIPTTDSPAVEYDPVAVDREGRTRPGGRRLVSEVARLNTTKNQAIEEFTSEWGLLGLFQHHLLQVRYVPTKDGRVQPFHAPTTGIEYCDGPDFREVRFFGTVPLTHVEGSSTPALRPTERHPGDEVADFPERVQEERRHQPGRSRRDPSRRGEVITSEWPGATLRVIPLMDYFPAFFPGLFQRREEDDPTFPSIHSPDLWVELCEPLGRFQKEVEKFQATFHLCSLATAGEADEDKISQLCRDVSQRLRSVHPALALHQSVSPLSPPGDSGDTVFNRWQLEYRFPSLLSVAYMLLLEDLEAGRFFRYCANERCRNAFLADRRDNIYCSLACTNAQKQRELRRRRAHQATIT